MQTQHAGYAHALAALQEKLAIWQWDEFDAGAWKATTIEPWPVDLLLSGPPTANNPGVRVHAIVQRPEVPSHAHGEVALFCAAANRFFSGWNLQLHPDGHIEQLVAVGSFDGLESYHVITSELIQAMVFVTIKAAIVAAPVLQSVLDGLQARKAVALANEWDDRITVGELFELFSQRGDES